MLLRVTGVKKLSNATALRNYTFYFITFSTVTKPYSHLIVNSCYWLSV